MKTSIHCNDCGAAISVKLYTLNDAADGGDDGQRTAAFENAQESFWRAADRAAKESGYSGAGACGRSGGWCVPYDGADFSGAESDIESQRFAEFSRRIEELMRTVPQLFNDELQIRIDDDARQEADDIATELLEAQRDARADVAPQLAEALRLTLHEIKWHNENGFIQQKAMCAKNVEDARTVLAAYDAGTVAPGIVAAGPVVEPSPAVGDVLPLGDAYFAKTEKEARNDDGRSLSDRFEFLQHDLMEFWDSLPNSEQSHMTDDGISGAIVRCADGEHYEIWLTDSSRPFDVTADYTCVRIGESATDRAWREAEYGRTDGAS